MLAKNGILRIDARMYAAGLPSLMTCMACWSLPFRSTSGSVAKLTRACQVMVLGRTRYNSVSRGSMFLFHDARPCWYSSVPVARLGLCTKEDL
jgi:hypothetical protein